MAKARENDLDWGGILDIFGGTAIESGESFRGKRLGDS
jgi:hypothetical protein